MAKLEGILQRKVKHNFVFDKWESLILKEFIQFSPFASINLTFKGQYWVTPVLGLSDLCSSFGLVLPHPKSTIQKFIIRLSKKNSSLFVQVRFFF